MYRILPDITDRAPYKCVYFSPCTNTPLTLLITWCGQSRMWCPNFLGMISGSGWKSQLETRSPDLLSGAHIHPGTLFDGQFLKPHFTHTYCIEVLALLWRTRWFQARHYGWAHGPMWHEKYVSTEHKEWGSYSQGSKLRTVKHKSLGSKWFKAPLWSQSPGRRWWCYCRHVVALRILVCDWPVCWGAQITAPVMGRKQTVSLCGERLLMPAASDHVEQFPDARPSWECNILAPASCTFRTVRNTLLLLKPHSL